MSGWRVGASGSASEVNGRAIPGPDGKLGDTAVSQPPRREAAFPLRLDQLKPADKSYVRPGPTVKIGANEASGVPTRQQDRVPAASTTHRALPAGLGSDAVLQAMAAVPRHLFVDAALVAQAYEDTSLPIGHGQTISKPSVVARMIELLMGGVNAQAMGQLGRTLEIGTGCGYQAALLSMLARTVISVERLKALHDKARELLAPTRSTRLRLVYGDGTLGHAPNAPYDSIIAAAGGDSVPLPWLDQLAIGGRLVSPVCQPGTGRQVLVVIDRIERGYVHRIHEAVNFVPLKSGLVG
jgi:protein-L-isoaspartate(D-aspartate) O-methyltransferase